MTDAAVYLKQNILFEPLINKWYAWSGLIPPATAAMYISNSHLKILQSFVTTPQIHIAALRNPKMLGGPFINYDETRVAEIQHLLEITVQDQAELIKLAEAIKELGETLGSDASGMSLEPVYEKVPESLKGYVELIYDLNDHASIRFIEGLLYCSRYYRPASQSISLSLLENDDRSFVFSTPRLKNEKSLHLDIQFNDPRLDALFKMKEQPLAYGHVKEFMGVSDEDDRLFSAFFTDQSSPPRFKYDSDEVRIRYFGHACVLIESKDISVLTDPLVNYKLGNEIPCYSYTDLPPVIDYVLITHAHQDHCMFETLLQLRHKISNVVVPKNNAGSLADPSLKLIFKNIGFNNVIEIDEMETILVEGGQIMSLPFLGEHADLNVRTKTAYLVSLSGASIVFAADSNNIEPAMYQHIYDVVKDIDVLFLGMECDGGPLSWLYGPLLTRPLSRKSDQSRRLSGSDYQRGMNIVNCLKPNQVYVYAMGQEPWLKHVTSIQYTSESRPIIESNKLVEDCLSRGLVSERLFGRKEIFLNGSRDG